MPQGPAREAIDAGAFFDGRSDRYDGAYDATGWGGHVLRTRLAATLSMIGFGPGESLDVGMGPGRLCEVLADRGWNVSGVDLSAEMVRRARRRLPGAAERMCQGRLDALPFSDGSFDLVTATGVLEYADSVPDALRELARVLRPGGRAVVSIPNAGSLHGLSRRATDPLARAVRGRRATVKARRDRIPPIETFERLVGAAGFRITVTRYVGALIVPAPLDRFLPRASQKLGEALEARQRVQGRAATQIVIAAVRLPAAAC